MTKQNITAWFFEGGMVGIPKNLLGMMEPLGLNFDDLGRILYLLYCGTDQIKKNDRYAIEAAKTLHAKGIVHWYADQEMVDFSPVFDKMNMNLGEQPVYVQQHGFSTSELNYGDFQKNLERSLARMLTQREKHEMMEAMQRYNWSYELMHEIFIFYNKNYRKHTYSFSFFCQMAYGAQVEDKKGFIEFTQNLDTYTNKTIEVLRRLGKKNYPSEPQKEKYLKWTNLWKFSHEMILAATNDTTNADNPSFNYLEEILKTWKEKGIDSPEKLKVYKQQEQEEKAQQSKANKTKKSMVKENFESTPRDLNFLIE